MNMYKVYEIADIECPMGLNQVSKEIQFNQHVPKKITSITPW
jgi:hypothetical protein